MSGQKRKGRWMVSMVLLVLLGACATPITHPVPMDYAGGAQPATGGPVSIGIQPFVDQRTGGDPYLIGYRQVRRGEQERYVSSPDDVARSITRMTGALVRQKGGDPGVLTGWDFSPDQMLALSDAFDVFIGGEVRRLQCDAERRFMHTRMVLELDMVFYVGKVREGVVHRRPIQMKTERVTPAFGPRELGRFLNDMLSQALEKGCRDIF